MKCFCPALLLDLTRVDAFQALALVEEAFLWKLWEEVLTGVATSWYLLMLLVDYCRIGRCAFPLFADCSL